MQRKCKVYTIKLNAGQKQWLPQTKCADVGPRVSESDVI